MMINILREKEDQNAHDISPPSYYAEINILKAIKRELKYNGR